MRHHLNYRLLEALALCLLSTPVFPLGSGTLPDSQATQITRQVEQKAAQRVERAMDKRVAQRIEARADTVRERLANLPSALPIHTTNGRRAFNDIVLDDGIRTVERQWLATATAPEIAALDQPGITVLERRELSRLKMTVVRFEVTPELDSREALQDALPELADRLDRNHVFAPQSGGTQAAPESGVPRWQSLCTSPVRIGMVDTSIATDHPVFTNARIVQERFLDMAGVEGRLREPKAHGTAIASLIAGSHKDRWPARLPEAQVFNASVFYDRDRNLSGATLGHLLEGLNWLAGQDLAVINISLTGPDNRLLAAAVQSLKEQGIVLVAAVGNQGPSAPPLYPAAYADVVGVTAVDADGEPYRWANRGEQVMFAAPGVSVPVADPDGGMVSDSGTSLAAPVIAAALACQQAEAPADQAIAALIEQARDLGEQGRDPLFGHGLLDY